MDNEGFHKFQSRIKEEWRTKVRYETDHEAYLFNQGKELSVSGKYGINVFIIHNPCCPRNNCGAYNTSKRVLSNVATADVMSIRMGGNPQICS